MDDETETTYSTSNSTKYLGIGEGENVEQNRMKGKLKREYIGKQQNKGSWSACSSSESVQLQSNNFETGRSEDDRKIKKKCEQCVE